MRPPFPFAGPVGGWAAQTISFMSGMAVVDLANAFLTLVVVVGFFRQAGWVAWLGTVTLTVSLYAEIAFTWGALAAGAPALGIPYLWIHIPFIPIAVLSGAWWYWITHGKL